MHLACDWIPKHGWPLETPTVHDDEDGMILMLTKNNDEKNIMMMHWAVDSFIHIQYVLETKYVSIIKYVLVLQYVKYVLYL